MASKTLEILIQAKLETDKAFKEARGGLDKIGDAAKRNRGKLLAVAGGVAAIGFASIKAAADFEKGMAEVNTLINVSQKDIQSLGDDVRDLSTEFGINAVDATKALYQTISAGIEPAKALEFLGVAAKTSIGGITDLDTAVDGLTTVVNAFGFDAGESEAVADVLFETMRRGKTTIGELSDFMFQAAPVSAALGVKFEEMSAAIATLTKQGTPTRVAMTGVRQAIVSLAKPTDDMSELLSRLGFESGIAAIETLGLQGTFEALATKTGATQDELVKAVGSVEALTTVLGLTGQNAQVFKDDLDAITNSAGAMEAGFDLMAETTAQKLAIMNATITELRIELGEALLPVFKSVVGIISKVVEGFGNMSETTRTVIIIIGGVAGALAAVGLILPGLILLFSGLAGAVGVLGTALTLLALHPIVAVIAVLGAIAIAGSLIWGINESGKVAKDAIANLDDYADSLSRVKVAAFDAGEVLDEHAFGLKAIAGMMDTVVDASGDLAAAVEDKNSKAMLVGTDRAFEYYAALDAVEAKSAILQHSVEQVTSAVKLSGIQYDELLELLPKLNDHTISWAEAIDIAKENSIEFTGAIEDVSESLDELGDEFTDLGDEFTELVATIEAGRLQVASDAMTAFENEQLLIANRVELALAAEQKITDDASEALQTRADEIATFRDKEKQIAEDTAIFRTELREAAVAEAVRLLALEGEAVEAVATRNAAAFAAVQAKVMQLPSQISVGIAGPAGGGNVASLFKASQQSVEAELVAAKALLASGNFGGGTTAAMVQAEIDRLVGIAGQSEIKDIDGTILQKFVDASTGFKGDKLGQMFAPPGGFGSGGPPMLPGMSPFTINLNVEGSLTTEDAASLLAQTMQEMEARGGSN